jgi:hypothetical protein
MVGMSLDILELIQEAYFLSNQIYFSSAAWIPWIPWVVAQGEHIEQKSHRILGLREDV